MCTLQGDVYFQLQYVWNLLGNPGSKHLVDCLFLRFYGENLISIITWSAIVFTSVSRRRAPKTSESIRTRLSLLLGKTCIFEKYYVSTQLLWWVMASVSPSTVVYVHEVRPHNKPKTFDLHIGYFTLGELREDRDCSSPPIVCLQTLTAISFQDKKTLNVTR